MTVNIERPSLIAHSTTHISTRSMLTKLLLSLKHSTRTKFKFKKPFDQNEHFSKQLSIETFSGKENDTDDQKELEQQSFDQKELQMIQKRMANLTQMKECIQDDLTTMKDVFERLNTTINTLATDLNDSADLLRKMRRASSSAVQF